jgi:universal stress protein E
MAGTQLILVAVKDAGARKQIAISKAAQLAAATGASIELFHAITAALYVDAFALQGLSVREVQQQWRDRVRKTLERKAEKLRSAGLKVRVTCEWDSPAYDAVVRRAARAGADLIVAERHAKQHLLPSILRFNDWELLRRSPVPVLLVKTARPYKRPTILAAIDPSHSFAKPARLDAAILKEAARLGAALRGNTHAVHAFPGTLPSLDPYSGLTPELGQQMQHRAANEARKNFTDALSESGIPKARRHLVAGHAVDVIPRLAKKHRAAIVVMGAISRSGFKRLVIGNIAEQVLDALPCDVLVLKPAEFKSRVAPQTRGVQLIATPAYR